MLDISELLGVLVEDTFGLQAKRISQLSSQQHSSCSQLPVSILSFHSLELRPHGLDTLILSLYVSVEPGLPCSYPHSLLLSLAALLISPCGEQR